MRSPLPAILLAVTLIAAGCSTFHARPGHGSMFGGNAGHKKASAKKKSQGNPLTRMGSIFSSDEPEPPQSIDDFMGLERPEY